MSHISTGTSRGGETNSGGFELKVAMPPHISATTPGESNTGGYELRVAAP